ncbi:MAG: hypothetical protein CME07_04835, partial [Gemmatimonadetes bacterium]|nr:hypothetical protein [Gemmatimonadota bacterium]
ADRAVLIVDDDLFVKDEMARDFPPGTWTPVGSAPAMQWDHYLVEGHTAGDSTDAAVVQSVFVVSAHTVDPGIWFVSAADSGVSVDNLPPAVPDSLVFASQSLAWEFSPSADFAHFSVYGGPVDDFAAATLVAHTLDTTMDVSGAVYPWYFVTALDYSGNESDPATVSGATASGADESASGAASFALFGGSPNPFRAATVISFDIPDAGRAVVAVHDVSGRRVATLFDGEAAAGRHLVHWSGLDQLGASAAPGIYFVTLESGSRMATEKVLRLR